MKDEGVCARASDSSTSTRDQRCSASASRACRRHTLTYTGAGRSLARVREMPNAVVATEMVEETGTATDQAEAATGAEVEEWRGWRRRWQGWRWGQRLRRCRSAEDETGTAADEVEVAMGTEAAARRLAAAAVVTAASLAATRFAADRVAAASVGGADGGGGEEDPRTGFFLPVSTGAICVRAGGGGECSKSLPAVTKLTHFSSV